MTTWIGWLNSTPHLLSVAREAWLSTPVPDTNTHWSSYSSCCIDLVPIGWHDTIHGAADNQKGWQWQRLIWISASIIKSNQENDQRISKESERNVPEIKDITPSQGQSYWLTRHLIIVRKDDADSKLSLGSWRLWINALSSLKLQKKNFLAIYASLNVQIDSM